MTEADRRSLIAGTMYWVGLGILFAAVTVAGLQDDRVIAAGGFAAAAVLWVVGSLIGAQGQDRFGKLRSGVDRGR